MYKIILMIRTIAGGIYGGAVGGYLHSKNRSRKKKITLGVLGLILVGIEIIAIVGVLSE